MAGGHVRGGEVFGTEGFDHGVEEDGRLGHACGAQVLVAAFEHDVGEAEAEDLIGALHHRAGLGVALIEVFPHSRELGTLTGE